jgi:uncharacterized LabA/DUF88 family protein
MTTPRNNDGQNRLAVLIDADNAQASVIEGLLSEVAKFGLASVKRIYGDFTAQNSNSWKKVLLKHSINPVQQFAYTTGKNATDSSLIIDAMDLMHTGRFDGMCLVSSDSDFTRLAQRLREEGLVVYGFGEQKTPDAFVQACDKFIYTEVLRPETPEQEQQPQVEPAKAKAAEPVKPKAEAPAQKKAGPLPLPLDLMHQAIEEASDEEGWAHLGEVGGYLGKIKSDFDPRLYGEKKLSDLFRKNPKNFNLVERGTTTTGGKVLYVKSI